MLVDERLFCGRGDGGLSLLGIVLADLWDGRQDTTIGDSANRAIGGIAGSVARHADHVLGSPSRERRTTARNSAPF